jgi:hypothetical protein
VQVCLGEWMEYSGWETTMPDSRPFVFIPYPAPPPPGLSEHYFWSISVLGGKLCWGHCMFFKHSHINPMAALSFSEWKTRDQLASSVHPSRLLLSSSPTSWAIIVRLSELCDAFKPLPLFSQCSGNLGAFHSLLRRTLFPLFHRDPFMLTSKELPQSGPRPWRPQDFAGKRRHFWSK